VPDWFGHIAKSLKIRPAIALPLADSLRVRFTLIMIQPVATHIELRPNREGQPRAFIAGTRVRVQDIYAQAEI
jgi:hypothetical protein